METDPTETPGDDTPAETDAPTEAAPAPSGQRESRGAARERRAGERHRSASARTQRAPEDRQAERAATRRQKSAERSRYRNKVKARRAEERPPSPEGGLEPVPETPPVARKEGRPKVRQGLVVSDKADKTITVRIDDARRHRRYEKIVRSTSTLHAHDEANDAHEGDTVSVVESRPLSATKRWRLVEVLERAQ